MKKEKKNCFISEIVGKYFKQNCGDILLVLNEAIKDKGKLKYKCQFQNHPCEVFARIESIKEGKVTNPQIEVDEFINVIWKQNCGDFLKIIRRVRNQKGEEQWEAEFQKYPHKVICSKKAIKNGNVFNPEIERIEFVEKLWLQHCGDTLKIIKKTNIKIKEGSTEFFWECEFLNHPYKILCRKSAIIKGIVLNPQIEIDEFINKLWPQKCGDIIKVIRKTEYKSSKLALYEVEYQKYKYRELRLKDHIIKGICINPRIEIEEFVKKEWKQDCGDSLRILKKLKDKTNRSIWEAEFINVPCKIIAPKYFIIKGICKNPLITSYYNREETSLRKYIQDLTGKEYSNYNDVNYEIDIYLPELKIGFEYNGSYWHQEGKYKPIGYHEKKFKYFLQKGILIFNIWDYFWFKNFNRRGQTLDFCIREEAKIYVKNIINAFIIKKLPQLI